MQPWEDCQLPVTTVGSFKLQTLMQLGKEGNLEVVSP